MERNLYTYTYLDLAFDDVEEIMRHDPVAMLAQATESAGRRTEQLATTLQADIGSFQVGRDATVAVGPLRDVDAHCVSLPIHWHDEDHRRLFPAMEGFIEAAQLASNPPVTQLSFIGHYRPPLGLFGALGDAALGRRIAEMTVHHFLVDVADRLRTQVHEAHAAA